MKFSAFSIYHCCIFTRHSPLTTKKMLHLAQVQTQGLLGSLGLLLLARQETEYHWTLITERTVIPEVEIVLNDITVFPLTEGLLVLVEVSPIGEIESLENASNWVLELVKTYLTNGITPAFLQQEIERAEQWRQSLSLQTQELARRALEVEARREQIQALEESLRRDQESSNHNL